MYACSSPSLCGGGGDANVCSGCDLSFIANRAHKSQLSFHVHCGTAAVALSYSILIRNDEHVDDVFNFYPQFS